MKKSLLIFLFCITLFPAFGQRLGIIGGYSLTNTWAGVTNNAVDFNTTAYSGFHIGPIFAMDITNRWGLEIAPQYAMRGTHFIAQYKTDYPYNINRQLYYLDIPLHAFVKFPAWKGQFLLFAGPSINIGLHGKDISWESNALQKPVNTSTEIFGEDNRMKRLEIAADLGLGYEYKNLQVRASYQAAINNPCYQDYNFGFDIPNYVTKYYFQGVFKISAAYIFDLRK